MTALRADQQMALIFYNSGSVFLINWLSNLGFFIVGFDGNTDKISAMFSIQGRNIRTANIRYEKVLNPISYIR